MKIIENYRTAPAPVADGRISKAEFAKLAFEEKLVYLQQVNGPDKARIILDDQHPELLVQSLPMRDIFQIIHEVGAENSVDIFQLATPEQVRFILDLELWTDWTISAEETAKWIEIILSTGDLEGLRLLSYLDPELLIIFLKKTIQVGGGLDDIINSEDHQVDWDHTFDEVFYLRIHDGEHGELVLKLLELLHNGDHGLYRSLLLGAESELLSELEEAAGQFRAGRLADEGLPASIGAEEFNAGRVP